MADKNNDKDKDKDVKKKSALATAATRAKNANRTGKTGGGLREYFRGVKVEVKKVVWPTRKELVLYTWTVLVTCTAFSLAIWLVDTLFIQLLKLTLGFSF